jgi:hypothetical protein
METPVSFAAPDAASVEENCPVETRLIMIRKFAICQKVFDVDLPQSKSKNA